MDSWGTTPRASIEAECTRRGRGVVVRGCIDILEGRRIDSDLLRALAGPASATVLAGREGGPEGYWPRVWAARGLLHVWADEAAPAIVVAATDAAWRVREMAAKVVARHLVDEGLAAMAALLDDPVPRVRAAAARALERLIASGA